MSALARSVRRPKELALRKHLRKCRACMGAYGYGEGAPCAHGIELAGIVEKFAKKRARPT